MALSLQRLNYATGATDGSSAPSAMTSVSRSGGSCRGKNADDTAKDQRVLDPLAQSIAYLADSHREVTGQRAADREHERQLEENKRRSDIRESSRKRVFKRRSQLRDLARQYRRLTAEAEDATDPSSRRKAEFYRREGLLLEDEIRELEEENLNSDY